MSLKLNSGGTPVQSKDMLMILGGMQNPSYLYNPAFGYLQFNNIKAVGAGFVTVTHQNAPFRFDRFYIKLLSDGTEKHLSLSTLKDVDCAEIQVWVNGHLEATIDDYAAVPTVRNEYITLTYGLRPGVIWLYLVAQTKNALSTGYTMNIAGALFQ